MKKRYPEPYKRTGRPYYYFKYTEADGRVRTISTGETLKRPAEAAVRLFVDEKERRANEPPAHLLTFRDYSARYFVWEKDKRPTCPHAENLITEGKTIGRMHVLRNRRLLDRVLEAVPTFGDLALGGLRRGDILNLRADLMAKFPPGTVGKMMASVKIVLAEADYREDIEGNPAAKVGAPKYQKRERAVLTIEEIRHLITEQPGRMSTVPWIRAAMIFAAGTGTRLSEIRGLRWKSVDLKTGDCQIAESIKGEGDTEGVGLPKFEKTRHIVLPRFVIESLVQWKKDALHTGPDDFIFGTPDGDYWSRETMGTAFRGVWAAMKPEGDTRWITIHSLRHSLNTHLLAAGANAFAVGDFLGWSSEAGRAMAKVQEDYRHAQLYSLRQVADLIDALYTGRAAETGSRGLRVV